MKCEDLMAALNEYLDGKVDSSICQEFQQHLSDCNPCQVVVDNVRKTIKLCKDGQTYEIPSPCREKLHAMLRERWKEKNTKEP
jgi:predicted anti-sigma-YlaC factor YlaD